MVYGFDGKVVVVTGGTSGIGLAAAKAFAKEGAFVFITGRRQDTLDDAVAQIGGKITGVRGDMSNLEDIDRLYDAVQQKHGQIDVIFANAGGGTFAPLGEITEEHYQSTFDSNVKGVLFTVQKALPLLRDGASIVLNASNVSAAGTPAFSIYSATKAAVRSFARNWMLDLKDRHIRVNAVSPGVTDTAGLNHLFGNGEQAEGTKTYLASLIPSGRVAQPEEIARSVLFLASNEASFINGIELYVDGGQKQI
ncbi:short-chain dehydrogenase/reductase SDR [Acetobacter nitrogenifigens DSM 23921 = NBRC 105050]|uniref:Dehydrogenase n=1 Tax=Acetobacter nitrogenifigens DSM 23921 = NBRC 105050 TaxID=1120919 RepID=A0A511X924_9PROT|nr:SDR family oxidoreductase [Acetobacter nitrogenifigens]GBQ87079.1 short-chain dehydrogenase/reductase SDR [Acetobacter nitrogenifigens DSM 23921 = NBRC 105050]GEN59446.1 dehydrogenase [Acetobacter nitrogenifigens DSM 23921 = NBRC 105050]